jgi:hypothetical protein
MVEEELGELGFGWDSLGELNIEPRESIIPLRMLMSENKGRFTESGRKGERERDFLTFFPRKVVIFWENHPTECFKFKLLKNVSNNKSV